MAIPRTLLLAAILVVAVASDAFPFCFEEAGAQYGINPQILRAIAKVESNFNPAAINMNTNGTYDFGLMQINSIWGGTIGKERWKLLGDACYNAKTGAWILAMCMNKYGYTWKAIGCYNSQTPVKRDRYSKMVFNQLQRVKPLAQETAYTKAVLQRPPSPPSLAASSVQSALPAFPASQGPMSSGLGINEGGVDQGPSGNATPSLAP